MSLIIFAAIGMGIYMKNFLPSDATNHREIYDLHKSIGVIAFFLIIIRIINRFLNKTPEMIDSMARSEKILAKFVHFALYFLMFLTPLSGYLMSNSYGFAVKLFSLEMPNLISTNYQVAKIFSDIHTIFSYTLLFLISLHIAGVIKHLFFDKAENNVLKRML
jgi:cytochrome b561